MSAPLPPELEERIQEIAKRNFATYNFATDLEKALLEAYPLIAAHVLKQNDQRPDSEADGVVFCGKCGQRRQG